MKKIFTSLAIASSLFGYDVGDYLVITGDERAGYLIYDYGNPDGESDISKGHRDSHGFYVIPKLSIETKPYYGFKAKITGAAATDFGLNNKEDENRNFVFKQGGDSFAILQEAFIEYDSKTHNALVGRNEIVTPMIDKDDWYMQADSFEVGVYRYKGLEGSLFWAGYFAKMAGVWDSGADGTKFETMADASFVGAEDKANAKDGGVYFGAYEFKNDNHSLQAWEYYAPDLYNTFFFQYDFSNKYNTLSYVAGIQIIDFQEVGNLADNDQNGYDIDYTLYQARFDGEFDNGFGFATGIAKYTDGDGQNQTLGAWGGYPYFANGMIFHFFEAGNLRNAASYKVQGSYDFTKAGIKNLVFKMRYTYYDLDEKYSFSSKDLPQTYMQMIGLQVKYSFLNGGYFTGTYEKHDTEHEPKTYALRLIGGYKF